MLFTVRCILYTVTDVYENSNTCLLKDVWSKKVLLIRNDFTALFFQQLLQRSQQSVLSYGLSENKPKWEYQWWVKKWNVNDWCLKRFACWLVQFSPSSQCGLTLDEVQGISSLLGTDWLCSNYNWWHSNDASVIKIQHIFPMKVHTKCIFQIFHILKTDRMTPLYNLFMERPW